MVTIHQVLFYSVYFVKFISKNHLTALKKTSLTLKGLKANTEYLSAEVSYRNILNISALQKNVSFMTYYIT